MFKALLDRLSPRKADPYPELTPMTVARLPILFVRSPSLQAEVLVTILPSKDPSVLTLTQFLETHRPDIRTEDLLYASFAPGVTAIRVAPLR